MTKHLRQDFYHNHRYCDTTEAISIKHAIRLHERRGWTLRATYRTRINNHPQFSAEFAVDTAHGPAREHSSLVFRFS